MNEVVDLFIEAYRKEFDYYEKLAKTVGAKLEDALNESGVRAIVSHRAKGVDSLQRKLRKRDAEEAFERYKSVSDIYKDIVDLAGVRVALYFPGDIDVVTNIIDGLFLVNHSKHFPTYTPQSEQGVYEKRFNGYHAKHFRVKLEDGSRYANSLVEIQVASVLMHAWSEVEHDLVYKPMSGGASKEELMILDEINGMVIAGNIALERLQAAIGERVNSVNYIFKNHYELAAYISKELGFDEIFNAKEFYDLLAKLDLLTKEKVEALIIVVRDILNDLKSKNEDVTKSTNENYKGGYLLGLLVNTISSLHTENVRALICSGYTPFESKRIKQDMLTFAFHYHNEPEIVSAFQMAESLCKLSQDFDTPSIYSLDKYDDFLAPLNDAVNPIEAQAAMGAFLESLNRISSESFDEREHEELLALARIVAKKVAMKD